VTLTLNAGSGYTVSATSGSAAVAVSDDDDPPQDDDTDTPDDPQDDGPGTPDTDPDDPTPPPPPDPDPEISVTAGSGITEGQRAAFTVSASPAPKTPLTVTVTVTQVGDYGATTGTHTVVIGTGGSATLNVATTGDSADEADGSVTITVSAGSGYTVSTAHGAATVTVADDDVPQISVTAGPGITEGGSAVFTITASPAPAGPLAVTVTFAQTGDYGVTAGTRTVDVPAGGTVKLAVATAGDSADEADGSVTLTVSAGSGYTVSTAHGAATVTVADDDNPPPPPTGASLSIRDAEVSENGHRYLRLMVYLSETPDETVTVQVTTRDVTAEHGADYRGHPTPSRTLTFAKGTRLLYRYIYIPILDDNTPEGDETFQAILTNPTGATISRGTATITIKDN
ncbi:MAG: hypothetical protein OXF75_05715, partial [Acidimicrobiaceae bacterium]|nr:hypothetical protein [Acidimicrobiaceae bacterium]